MSGPYIFPMDISDTMREATGGKPRPKHDIGKVDGRIEHKSFRKMANDVLEEGFPSLVRKGLTKIFGEGIGNFLADMVVEGAERTIYGSRKKGNGYSKSYYNYCGQPSYMQWYSSSQTQAQTTQPAVQQTAPNPMSIDFQDVTTMRDRPAAVDLLDKLNMAIARYGNVSIAELFDALNFSDYPFTYEYYGWKMPLTNVQIRRNAVGYWLDLPTAVSLKE